MSLIDTIKGAREEAAEAGSLLSSKKNESAAQSTTESETTSSSAGFSRRSAARAKPAREAAGSVRTSAKSQAEMSKEEKKAAREARRTEEDLLYEAKKAYLNMNEAYRASQRLWWGLLGGGMACSIISFMIMRYMQSGQSSSESMATVSVVFMVLAYALIIGAFIYDLVKVRPMRNEANDKLGGMSKKRLNQLIADEEARKAAKKSK